ncbi:MAG: sugar-binding transcriptional regulator [Spirochaetaceae bacterium]|nr:MAG: sugar-binding transcriptional regulator [Spirochaetaceae bacterium]
MARQTSSSEERSYEEAFRVATLYYYQGLNTEEIAAEMRFSRPKVSKLLNYARTNGLVQIKVIDSRKKLSPLEEVLRERFDLVRVHIVAAPEYLGEVSWLERVSRYTAHYLNATLEPRQTLGVAWGTTISEISLHLIPKVIPGLRIVQLNGSTNTTLADNRYAASILQSYAANYQASIQLFPVPSFFDYAETKAAMWRERSIRAILEMQEKADVLLYSIGSVEAGVPSRVYSGDFLEPSDMEQIRNENVVGDIATVFFRPDGSWEDIPLNHRASGPPLDLYRYAPRRVCVVSGRAKMPALHTALRSGYMNELIIDEPSARLLADEFLFLGDS